jgi:hypothetical protein
MFKYWKLVAAYCVFSVVVFEREVLTTFTFYRTPDQVWLSGRINSLLLGMVLGVVAF